MTWGDQHPVAVLSFALFFIALPAGFIWLIHDSRTPEQLAQEQKESDEQDRKFYVDSLANVAEFQAALKECRALQIKYRLSGSAVICAKWEITRQVDATVTDDRA